MQAQEHIELATKLQPEETLGQWNQAKRIAFRFVFVYFVLYMLPFPLNDLPWIGGPVFVKYTDWLWRGAVWIGNNILHWDVPSYPYMPRADTAFSYVSIFSFLIISIAATIVWSLIDRKRRNYDHLKKWLVIGVRFYLASHLIYFGWIKVFPIQAEVPALIDMLRPLGNYPHRLLFFAFIGASPAYMSLTGFFELLAGTLLIFPRLTTLGSLISVMVMVQVFIFNVCYGIGYMIHSTHMIVMATFLLLPDFRRLLDVLIFGRKAEKAAETPILFERKWLNRSAFALQLLFGFYLFFWGMYTSYQSYNNLARLAPRPPLYGIWEVEEFTFDGQGRPPMVTDEERWQRVVFDDARYVQIQSMGRWKWSAYLLQVDQENQTITLGKVRSDRDWKAEFTFEKVEPELVNLTGQMDGHQIKVRLRRFDESKIPLNRSGFSWKEEL